MRLITLDFKGYYCKLADNYKKQRLCMLIIDMFIDVVYKTGNKSFSLRYESNACISKY